MRHTLLSTGAAMALLVSSPSVAQSVGSTAPAVFDQLSQYEARSASFGNFQLSAGGEIRAEYDDNVFALPEGQEIGDAVANLQLAGELAYSSGPLVARLGVQATIRRFAEETIENSNAATVRLDTEWKPNPADTFNAFVLWDREVEDRGDIEARRLLGIGPRRYDIFEGGLGYRRQGSRFLFDGRASARKVDALAEFDPDRDYTTYNGQATVGYRPGGAFFLTATGFVARRDFRLENDPLGNDRDTTTIGGRLGIRFTDNALFEGAISAGIFRLDPDADALDKRTGVSIEGQVTYRPRRRTAIRLDAFAGDVASFRSGLSARNDTEFGLTIQQEIRHNLYAAAGLSWRRSYFYSVDLSKDTLVPRLAVEYLVNRNMSLFAAANATDRSGEFVGESFNRFRASAGLRFRF